jgi:hypothetical protein
MSVAAYERAELAERALVEKALETGAGIELALAVVLRQPLRPTHRMSVSTSAGQLVESVSPPLYPRTPSSPCWRSCAANL